MRTSYSRDHVKEKKEQEKEAVVKKEEAQEEPVSSVESKLIDAYESMENELYYIRQKELTESNINTEEGNSFEDISKEPKNNKPEKKKKKSNKGIIIGCSVAISVLVLGVGGYTVYDKFFNTGKALIATEESISRLYTSPEKTDIKTGISQNDLNEYYMELIGIQKKGENVDNAVSELDTIGYYLNDKATLENYNSDSFDLTTVGLTDSISSILQNTKEYSVSGLAVTINNMAKEVTSDYESFISLRQEMNGISDVMNFDEEVYKGRIDLVRHIPNKTELSAICEKLIVDKKAAVAQKKVQEAADDQARAEAEKALKEAQELQKKTQGELEATKKKLEEEAQKAAEDIKNQNGNVDSQPNNNESTDTPSETTKEKEPTQESSVDWSEQEGTFKSEETESSTEGSTEGIAIPIPQAQ